MSQLIEAIARELGPSVLGQVGSRVGATPQQTQAVASVAIPLLVAALAKNANQPGGAAALATAVERDHTPNLADQLGPLAGALLGGSGANAGGLGALLGAAASAMGGQAAPAAAQLPKALKGDKILSHVLGAQQGATTNQVAAATGVDANTVAALLPVLAPVVMSALGSQKQANGLDAAGLARFLAGEATNLGGAPAAQGGGFGADDLLKLGGALAQSGVLGKLFR